MYAFEFRQGTLTHSHRIRLHDVKLRAVPAGLAVDAEGKPLFAANVWGSGSPALIFRQTPSL